MQNQLGGYQIRNEKIVTARPGFGSVGSRPTWLVIYNAPFWAAFPFSIAELLPRLLHIRRVSSPRWHILYLLELLSYCVRCNRSIYLLWPGLF
jgi:hypothetical protein